MAAPLVRRILLIVFAVVAVALVVLTLVVRRALDPARLKPVAEERLSALLHVPVRIGSLDVTLFPSPALDGRDIDIGRQSHDAPPSLSLGSLHLAPVLSSLLSPTIVIDTAEIRAPRLNVLRDADGRWALPGPTHMPIGEAQGAPPTPQPPPSGASPQNQPGIGGTQASSPAGTSFEVRSFTLVDGVVAVYDEGQSAPAVTIDDVSAELQADAKAVSFHRLTARLGGSRFTGEGTVGASKTAVSLTWDGFKPDDMAKVFALAGVSPRPGLVVEGDRPLTIQMTRGAHGLDLKGRLAASRIVFPPLTATALESPLSYADGEFSFAPLRFTAYKGAFSGRIGTVPTGTPPTWHVAGTLEHLDLGEMLASATSLGNKIDGTGRLRLDVTGRRDRLPATSAAGTVTMALTDGVIRDFPLLGAINRSLQITEGSGNDTKFDRLAGAFALSGGTATTHDLQLVAGALTVSARGTIGLASQSLNLSGTARFTREKSRDLSQISRHVSGAKNENGEVEIPLTMTGTLQAPNIQVEVGKVLERAVKKEVERGIRRQLKRLFKP